MDFIFITKEHAHATREKVRAREGVWDEAAFYLKKTGEEAMKKGPWSVTFASRTAISGDPHDYFSEGTYWWPNPEDPDGPYIRRDGEHNPDNFDEHVNALRELGYTVLDLVNAGYYLEEEKYLDRAAHLLDVWFVNEETRMNPDMRYGQGIKGICDGRFIGLIDLHPTVTIAHALGFLSGNEKYAATVAGVKQWMNEMLDWLLIPDGFGWQELHNGNNHSGWCLAHMLCYAALNDRVDVVRQMADFYKETIMEQIEADGNMPMETARTNSFGYNVFGRTPLVVCCEVAAKFGIDLWHCVNSKGASFETAMDWFVPYFENPFSWKYQQILDADTDDTIFFQYGALRLEKPEYNAVNRQRREGRKLIRYQEPMGPLCLLEGFEP